jgi:hypothetical protein
VRPLPAPLLRAACWLAVVLAIALVLAGIADLAAMRHRLMAAPDLCIAAVASTLTSILAAIAAFELDLPDRSPRWALLPLPALALWIGVSGLGCARGWLIPDVPPMTPMHTTRCFMFIVGFSVPLSTLILLMLRRGYSLAPSLTGACAGLAVAAAAATLLNFFHPYDITAVDLAAHAAAVALVVGVCRYLANRKLHAPT